MSTITLRDRLARTDLWIYAVTAAVSSLITVIALQLWKADLSVPLTYRGDALPVGAHFKTVIERGWYESQPLLSAPTGQIYHDFPTADNLHMIAAKILALFTSDWAVALNAYFLIGFPLVAIAAVWFLRTCGVSTWLTISLATLYAIAPYHWIRGESHLWLASYYAIPLALGLVVIALKGQSLWGAGPSSSRVLRWVFSPTTRTVLFAALVATASSYYSVFFLILIAATGIFCLIRDRSWKRFWGAAAAGAVAVVVMLINMFPDLIYTATHGQNPLGLERSPGEAEYYALKLSQLLLPWPGHRIPILAKLRQEYDAGYVSLGEQPALGIVGALGLIAAMLIVAYLAFARVRRADHANLPEKFDLAAGLSGLVFVAFIFSTLGGLSTIISVFTSSLRGWNRMSIVIAMLCLAIVGLLLDMLIARWKKPTLRKWGAVGIALLLVVVGFFDQTPPNSDAEYDSNAKSFHANQEYFTQIQDSLPANAMVLILPYVAFPETSSPTGVSASDQLIPYLHTTTVRWSNGGIRGRPAADWPGELEQYGLENVATLAAAAGFSGILVDRPASANSSADLEAAVAESTQVAPLVDDSGRFAYFSLSTVTSELSQDHDADWFARASELITNPTLAYRVPGFVPSDDSPGMVMGENGRAAFSIVNASTSTQSVLLSFTLSEANESDDLALDLPGGGSFTREKTVDGTVISARLSVAPGTHLVTVGMTNQTGAPVSVMTITPPQVLNLDVVNLLAGLG